MKKNKNTNPVEQENESVQQPQEEVTVSVEELQSQIDEQAAKIKDLTDKVAELEDLKLRQMAEFDNYRRRTNKEKLDLLASAGEGIFRDMLPLIDDLERSMHAVEKYEDLNALKEGVQLIYQKFLSFLEQNNVKAIDTADVPFNTDEHEAITTFAAGEEKKGKVIDCTQKGYKLGEKVIRFAKVVVGE